MIPIPPTSKEIAAWHIYTSAGFDEENLPKGWNKQKAINYQINIWEPLKILSRTIMDFWAGLGEDKSDATELFSTHGVQGPWYGMDNSALAQNLWWNDYGSIEFNEAQSLSRKEDKLGLKNNEKSAENVMNALRYGNDSIYEEITEVVNNMVYWEISHPVLNIEKNYSADPEFDV